jgi:hypothetical protein
MHLQGSQSALGAAADTTTMMTVVIHMGDRYDARVRSAGSRDW